MTLRSQQTPAGVASLDMVTGDYVYGESGAGPRQLTSVLDAQCAQVANFSYDTAGRMTEDTGKLLSNNDPVQPEDTGTLLTYNGLDQLVHVELPGGTMMPLVYSYGYNGQRTYTQHVDGTEEFNFTESIRQEEDLRHHYLKIGSRTVARVTMRDLEASAPAAPPIGPVARPVPVRWLLLALAFALGLLLIARWRRRALPARAGPARGHGWALAPLMLLVAANLSCSFMFGSNNQATWTTEETIYFHQGFSAGPTMMTDSGGNIFSERRYEPFGVDIDTYSGAAGGIGPTSSGIDFSAEPTNILNKQSDPDTSWSYHGARWVSPQTARWHTPDPIVKVPDGKFMAGPWGLHPYQYVKQNPVIYWDPDGREEVCRSGCHDGRSGRQTIGSGSEVIYPSGGRIAASVGKIGGTATAAESSGFLEKRIGGRTNAGVYKATPIIQNTLGLGGRHTQELIGWSITFTNGLSSVYDRQGKLLGPGNIGDTPDSFLGFYWQELTAPRLFGLSASDALIVTGPAVRGAAWAARGVKGLGGHTVFHGTAGASALELLNGGKLSSEAATALKIDGGPGFFTATHFDDAWYFAARREGTVLQIDMSEGAVRSLEKAGAVIRPIPQGARRVPFSGSEFVIPTEAFGTFNKLRKAGAITVKPGL